MRYLTLLAAAPRLAICGLPAQASSVHKIPPLALHAPKSLTAMPAKNSIVGTWLTSYDGGVHNAFTQWHKDGTTAQIVDQPPKTGTNVQLGDWASNGDGTVSHFLIGWTYDDKGKALTGYFTKSETDTPSGDSYSGSFEVTFYDLSGNILFQHDGTLTATRVAGP